MDEDNLRYAPQEDIDFFNKCIEGLPKSEVYSCGAHSVKAFREIVKFVQPKFIIEIGFNVGYSASMWMELSRGMIVSIDISKRAETIKAASITRQKYYPSFMYVDRNDKEAMDLIRLGDNKFNSHYDMAFIDGSHEFEDVIVDIGYVTSLGIPWIAFDDVLPQFGRVQDAIDQFPQLKLVKTWKNIALYKNTLA